MRILSVISAVHLFLLNQNIYPELEASEQDTRTRPSLQFLPSFFEAVSCGM
jgi:hypothetical protein